MANQPIINPPTPIAIGSPVQGGTSGLYLAIDGNGNLTQQAVTPTTPGGSSGQIQYNNGTGFAGSANLTWDNTNARLAIGDYEGSGPLTISGVASSLICLLLNTDGAGNAGWETENDAGSILYTGVYGSSGGSGTILYQNAFIQCNTANLAVFNTAGGIQLAVGGIATANVALNITSSGAIGIGAGVTPNASALVEIDSTTQGFLKPQMTTTQKNAISSPKEGLEVYDLTLHAPCWYNGSAWKTVTGS